MSSPDLLEPPSGLNFGELLDWHLRRGTRPPGSEDQGEPWIYARFANAVFITERQLKNWRNNNSLPNDIRGIERVLFGQDQKQNTVWRMELRNALKRTRSGARATGIAPAKEPIISVQPPPAGSLRSASNIPIRVPEHFLGRDDELDVITKALARYDGRGAVTALHGMRGVGKTTLAAAYAERHRAEYRVTWWIRAQTDAAARFDFVALGIRLGWVGADDKEERALTAIMERLRHEGEGILLIYDNAPNAQAIEPYLPRGGAAKVLVTSNDPAWRGVAETVEIRLWPKAIGADYLIARTGRPTEREAAKALSEVLGGLPLAHEQAAAYCERLHVSLGDYTRRFAAAPARLLDDARHTPAAYHDGLTVAKTFALAIDEAAKLHLAAEPLIVRAALLAPDAIPLFLFAEAQEQFGEPLAPALADDGLDEAVAALREFALVQRETIKDERDPATATAAIRLHPLVREIAAARCAANEEVQRTLVDALAAVYPRTIWNDPATWKVWDDPKSFARARQLDAHALALTSREPAAIATSHLLKGLVEFRYFALGAYVEAESLCKRELKICEKQFGPSHPETATSLNDLGVLLEVQGQIAEAQPLYERALEIREKEPGPEHPATAEIVSNLADVLRSRAT